LALNKVTTFFLLFQQLSRSPQQNQALKNACANDHTEGPQRKASRKRLHATSRRTNLSPHPNFQSRRKILRRGLEIPQKLLPLLMESHPSGNPVQQGKRTAQIRTPNPSFTFFREYRTPEMKRQTRFCRLFTACLFAASTNVVTNRKLTNYNAFLHRTVTRSGFWEILHGISGQSKMRRHCLFAGPGSFRTSF